ncbi:MAG: MATE family efflux transporter [Lentisphaeria bacterium]|nr:MATE family efflux transporter [Lentisphaeria bacterium]
MLKKDNAAYTRGSIRGTMIKTGFAMLAGTLAMSGYNIADTYFVGRLGKSPLAAMGFTFPVIMLIGCLFHGLASGVMTISAQALGGGRRAKAARLVTSGLLLIFLISIMLALLGMSTTGWIFERFGATGETLGQVKGYMNIWYFGCATASLSMTGNDLLIAAGDSKVASGMMIVGMLVNVIFDPLLIFGWGPVPAMGIRGAALATIGSQLVATVAVLWLLYRRHGLLRFERIPWRRLRSSWKLVVRFAVPASIGMLMMPIGSAIITRITASFGDTAVAATAAAGRLEMIAFIFPMAIGIPLLSMVGQNYGARLYGRIRICRRFSMRFAFLFLLAMAVVYFFTAPVLVRFFSPDRDVQKIMTLCMYIIPWGFGMIEIHRYAGFFFTGCGRPSVSAWLNALRILGLMIPLSLLALHLRSLEALFAARLAADVLAGGIGFCLAKRMVNRLPADGQPPPPSAAPLKFSRFLPNRLQAFATAQARIDGAGDTQ